MKARGLFKKLMVLLCAFAVLSVGADFKGLAVSSEGDGSSNSEEVSSQQEPDAPVLLEEMYAFVLTPGVDFYKDPTASAETVSKEDLLRFYLYINSLPKDHPDALFLMYYEYLI